MQHACMAVAGPRAQREALQGGAAQEPGHARESRACAAWWT